ncbi:MAG TPA: FAD-linked oxidase C-terminal domain-containing protein [Gammaproteobacteria bacterium]
MPHLSQLFLDELLRILPAEQVITDVASRWPYGGDNSRRHVLPDVVVFPVSHEEVARIVTLCAAHRVPVVARGRGTATTGASVPVAGGLVLSTERLNRILALDPDNRTITVQPGVTNLEVQQAAARYGFFWPPDPTSAAVCTVGGNLACNSAGPRAVKYGTTRDNVLGLRFVTGTGSAMHSGVHTTKGVVGYDLTRLLIGSEGTLAIITEAILKLTPLPEATRTLRALYRDIGSAARAVSRIMAQPVTPCALEFMDGNAVELIRERLPTALPAECQALLMIEVDGAAEELERSIQAVSRAAEGDGCLEIRSAPSIEESASLWEARKALSPALRAIAPKKINEDVVVPVSRIPALINGVAALGQRYGITIVNFGHAGNGNIHVNLLVDPDDPAQMQHAEPCLDEIFSLVLSLDGTLSGEHGIGLVKREFVARELEPAAITLMHAIKDQFDPFHILNPQKTLP